MAKPDWYYWLPIFIRDTIYNFYIWAVLPIKTLIGYYYGLAVSHIWEKYQDAVNYADSLFNGLSNTVSTLDSSLGYVRNTLLPDLWDYVIWLSGKIVDVKNSIEGIARDVANSVVQGAYNAINSLRSELKNMISTLDSSLGYVRNTLLPEIRQGVSNLRSELHATIDPLVQQFASFQGAVDVQLSLLRTGLDSAVSSLGNQISEEVRAREQAIAAIPNSILLMSRDIVKKGIEEIVREWIR